jgi:cell division protein FtsI (penicillin-binding protein 3)
MIFCENGVLIRGRRRLRDHHRYGRLSFTQIVEYSSNIGMVKLNERLSSTQFYDYMRRFGFGELSQVDFPGEDSGHLRPPRQWSAFSHDSLTIGQEITVTPLQLVTAFAAVANGGWLMRPRVVTRLVGGDAEQVIAPQARRRVLVRQTAAQLTAMLVGAVDRGTGKKAAVDGYTVAGKTGTAQKVDPGGGYSRRKVLASFVGFVPAEDPQAVILVMLDEPEKDRWGGTAAAPVFKRVAEQALHHLQVPSRYARPLTLEAQRMGDGG